MRCLLTGAGGFLGSHLLDARAGDELFSLARPGGPPPPKGVTACVADLLDRVAVASAVRDVRPELVFHLAAQSLPTVAWRDPEETFKVNVLGTLHLLDALRAHAPHAIAVVFCSSAEYAPNPTTNAFIAEDHPLAPSNPYGLSKIAADHLCLLYGRAYGMNVRRVRPFFVIGTRKTGDATSDFARGIVRVERGIRDHIEVGNLDAVRDFLDVRDAVKGFSLIAERGVAGEVYNVCSGRPTRLGALLDLLVARAKTRVDVRRSAAAQRPLDEPIRVGDPARLGSLGWQPTILLQHSLEEILEYWRARGPD
jgi:GDP-4-dehydro-6-deoxy-D-mannose reductase